MALRAIVKVSGSSTSANQLENGLTAGLSVVNFQTSFAYVNAKSNLTFANIIASVVTDSDSKHQWFYDQYTFADNLTIQLTVVKADTFVFTDSETFSFNKGLLDTPTLTESLARVTGKVLTDSQSLSDLPSIGFSRPVASTTDGFTDALSLAPQLNKSDSFSHTDTVALSPTKGLSDTFSVAETLARTVSYNLARSDSFTLDDVFSGMGVGVNKGNIFNFSDSAVFATAKVFSDTQSMAESIALSSSLVKTDSFSMTDSANVLYIPGSQGRFNAFAFNEITLNG